MLLDRRSGLFASLALLTACATGESGATGSGGGDGSGGSSSVTTSTASTTGTTTTGTTTTGTTTTGTTTGAGGGGTTNAACASPATLVMGTPVSGDTSIGTDGDHGSCGYDDGLAIAYAFTATSTGTVVFTVEAVDDHVVSVRTPGCNSALGELDCVDQVGVQSTEAVTVSVTSGQTYYVFVEAYSSGDESAFTLAASPSCSTSSTCATDEFCSSLLGTCRPEPAACVAPPTLTVGTPVADDTSSGADDTDGNCGVGNEIAYAFTAPTTGTYAFVLDTTTDQGLSVRTPGCNDVVDELDCVDSSSTVETLVISATANETYYVIVEAYDNGDEGSYTLEVQAPAPPQTCASPTAILLGVTVGDNTAATDNIDGGCVVGDGAESVFAFTAPASGMLTITAAQIGGDIGVSVRAPSCASVGDEVMCVNDFMFVDEEVVVTVVSGTTYYIVVDADTAGEEGLFTLNLTM